MKKLFFALITLACAASCSKETIEEGAWSPEAPYTTSMEVAVAGDSSRAFDENLNWSWEADDALFSCQVADQLYPNTLTLKENGKFGTDQYQFATTEAAPFFFAYPAASIDPAQLTITAPQTGTWSPVLCATTPATTVEQLQQIELTHLSSAYEVRVWEAGRSARKVITKAVLSSESDFVASWQADFTTQSVQQQLSGKELIVEQASETVVFNLGEGTFDFTLTLTDTEGNTLIVPASQQALSAGKRTVLNVEWKNATATTWYEDYANNQSSTLEGNTIYITANGGEVSATLNGSVATIDNGKISGLSSGVYDLIVKVGNATLINRKITVTSIPTVSWLVHSSYNSNDGSISKNDSYDGNKIWVKNEQLSDSYIQNNLVSKNELVWSKNGVTQANQSLTFNQEINYTTSYAAYQVQAKVTLQNGYVCQTPASQIYVTGIPYHADWRSNDYSNWKYINCSDKGSYVQINTSSSSWGGYVVGGVISPAFYTPNGSLDVYPAVAASTRATSASQSDRCYIYAGTQSSSAKMEGDYVKIYYNSANSTYPNTDLVQLDNSINLTSATSCLVFAGETYRVPVVGSLLPTYFYQIRITYNK